MNPDSLCAKCVHLRYSESTRWYFCQRRNRMNSPYDIVNIEKGFKTCINFEPRKEELYTQLEAKLEKAMEMLMKLREQNPSENLKDAEQSLDDAISFLHSFDDEQLVYRKEQSNG